MSPILTDEIVTYKGKIFQLQNDSLMLLFSEKEVKNRFQQKVAWLERISNVQLTSVNSSDSFDVLKPNDIFLFLDAEEKISIQEYAKENLDYISKLFGEKVTDVSELGFKAEISSDDDE